MSIQPWHQICEIREDVREGELQLAEFAADMNDVRTGDAPLIYADASMFFDRTYPTFRMKEMTREVLNRLAGQGGKPVLRLQVAYGGGKTHTLITLLHLAERGQALGDHHTVKEFFTFAGISSPPLARVALLPCDKMDVNEGLEVYGPDGTTRRVRTLWGALAYQLAGDAGYVRLKSHDEDFTVPAEPLLVDLLRAPLQDGLGALVLVDEAVWYYRQAVLKDPRMLGAIKDFYQVLNQAVAKVDRAVMVASLIASNIEANDQTGTQCLGALEDVFQRIAEPVEPVTRDDVAEILRRRLFELVPGEAERRPIVDAIMTALHKLSLRDSQLDQDAYARWMNSYPFHPDLINVLYQKWTQISGFHRTRGALRLLAYALRDSKNWDRSPIISSSALLPAPRGNEIGSDGGLSSSLNELVEICDESEKWTPILIGELEKARHIQAGLPTLSSREVEGAVLGAFLHSQPTGQRAAQHELNVLLAHPEIDSAALEEGLRNWRDRSWFLVENPDVWQLGTTPNLTRMHVRAMDGLGEEEIDDELRKRIQAVSTLKIADPGVVPHALPKSPRDVGDDAQLHYLILGPECAVEPSKPLPGAVEAYFNQKASPDDPRTLRNNLVALAPDISRLAGLREQVRRWLGWSRLEKPEHLKLLTEHQRKLLPGKKQEATHNLPEAVVGAYNILVAVDENGNVASQPLRTSTVAGGTPFERIKATLAEEERLVTTTLDPDLILPGSYFDLWGEGHTSRRVATLMEAFGQFPRLPRLLRPDSLYETLKRGVREGVIVLRLPRADGSSRTWWRISPDEDTLHRPELEVLPATNAELHHLEPELLRPEALDELWPTPSGPLELARLQAYFDGDRVPCLAKPDVLETALRDAVARGLLMARLESSSLYREPLPDGPLPLGLELLPSPKPLHGADLTPQALPGAWKQSSTDLKTIADALNTERGYTLPWSMLTQAVEQVLNLSLLELAPDSGDWPCSPVTADQVRLRVPEKIELSPQTVLHAMRYAASGTPTLRAIKEAIETQFFGGREVPAELFSQQAQAAIQAGQLEKVDTSPTTDLLSVRVRQPAKVLFAEAIFDGIALEKLADRVAELYSIAPELAYAFRVSLTAEGTPPDEETLKRLNELLNEIQDGWQLG